MTRSSMRQTRLTVPCNRFASNATSNTVLSDAADAIGLDSITEELEAKIN